MTTTYRPPTSLCPALLAGLRGTVLELGPGAGGNLAHYHEDVRWIGVEPKAANRDRTRRAAARLGRPDARVLPGRAERLDLPDRSVDAVAGTCSPNTWPRRPAPRCAAPRTATRR
jgi:SAM-dependent methyltransferase